MMSNPTVPLLGGNGIEGNTGMSLKFPSTAEVLRIRRGTREGWVSPATIKGKSGERP